MDLPSSDFLTNLVQFACVAVPTWIVVTASDTPRPDRRTLLVMVAGAAAAIVLAWPLTNLLGITSTTGVAIVFSAVGSIGGLWMSRLARRDPRLDDPAFVAKLVIAAFAGVAVVGLSWIAVDILDLGLVVLIPALCGIGLGALYLASVRRQLRGQR